MSGEKTTTFRLFDDKNIVEGEEVELIIWEENKVFTNAKITKVMEKPFSDLTEEDFKGHEKYSSDEEMYNSFKEYYGDKVNSNTIVKIIRFSLTNPTSIPTS
jgi:hypothetical protein